MWLSLPSSGLPIWFSDWEYERELQFFSLPILRFEQFEVKKTPKTDPVPWWVRTRSKTWSQKHYSSELAHQLESWDLRSPMRFTKAGTSSFGQLVQELFPKPSRP
jgi:hypothetical protein